MKTVKLEKYNINGRNIAELMWGRGGTDSYKTNRKGTFYYGCSAHGGYVVDSRVLTADEKEKIDEYANPINLNLLVQHRSNGDYVIGVSSQEFKRCGTIRRNRYSYDATLGRVEWVKLPVYVFEEDCDWSILEYFTDIRMDGVKDKEKHERLIKDCFHRWHHPDGEFKREQREEKEVLESGKYMRCSALRHDEKVKVIFRNKDGDEKAYFMDKETYHAYPLMKLTTIEDYETVGEVTEANNTEIYSPE